MFRKQVTTLYVPRSYDYWHVPAKTFVVLGSYICRRTHNQFAQWTIDVAHAGAGALAIAVADAVANLANRTLSKTLFMLLTIAFIHRTSALTRICFHSMINSVYAAHMKFQWAHITQITDQRMQIIIVCAMVLLCYRITCTTFAISKCLKKRTLTC